MLTSMGSTKNSSKIDPRDFFSEYGEARYGIKVISFESASFVLPLHQDDPRSATC